MVETQTTGFRIAPFLARLPTPPPPWRHQQREIAEVVELRVADLARPEVRAQEVRAFPTWPTPRRILAEQSGAEVDRAGRITVSPQLTLPTYPEVFALGDMVRVSDGRGGTLPPRRRAHGDAAGPPRRARRHPAAARQGRPAAVRYLDKGNLATLDRPRAVVTGGHGDRLGTVVDPELGEHVDQMGLHGRLAEVEKPGDLPRRPGRSQPSGSRHAP